MKPNFGCQSFITMKADTQKITKYSRKDLTLLSLRRLIKHSVINVKQKNIATRSKVSFDKKTRT